MPRPKLTLCLGSSCFARGNQKTLDVIRAYLDAHHLVDEVDLELTGALCQGQCNDGPVLIVDGEVHRHVDGGVALDILRELFEPKAGQP